SFLIARMHEGIATREQRGELVALEAQHAHVMRQIRRQRAGTDQEQCVALTEQMQRLAEDRQILLRRETPGVNKKAAALIDTERATQIGITPRGTEFAQIDAQPLMMRL